MSIRLIAEVDDELKETTEKLREELVDLINRYAKEDLPGIVITIELVAMAVSIAHADPHNDAPPVKAVRSILTHLEQAIAEHEEAEKRGTH